MEGGTGRFHVTLQHRYIEVPIHLRWRPGDSTVLWFLEGGPSIAYMVSEKVEWSESITGIAFEETRDDFRSVDVSLRLGAGLEVPLTGTLSIAGAVYYSYGLVEFFKIDKASTTLGIQPGIAIMYTL